MAEKEYIEREALIEGLMMYTWRDTDGWEIDDSDAKRAFIEEWLPPIPAANVRPVVRGTWVGIDDFPHDDWECDHCGCVVENTNDPWNYYHFCPNCGADMREES